MTYFSFGLRLFIRGRFLIGSLAALSIFACSAGSGTTPGTTGMDGEVGQEGDGDESMNVDASPGSGGTSNNGLDGSAIIDEPVEPPPWSLPSGFVPGLFGGSKLIGPVGSSSGSSDACDYEIRGVVRDFKASVGPHPEDGGERPLLDGGHPDFEKGNVFDDRNIVGGALSDDRTPIYASGTNTPTTSGKEFFDQWYRNVEGVNQAYVVELSLQPNGNVNTFESEEFFPLDGEGWGNEGYQHNYHFTTEFHTSFIYNGGEVFSFKGDDDLWIFINGTRVTDLGGVHQVQEAVVQIDTLGLEVGKTYPLDIFHAERQTAESNFRIDSTLQFVDCGKIIVK